MTDKEHANSHTFSAPDLRERLNARAEAVTWAPHPENFPQPLFPTVVRTDASARSWVVDRFGHRIFIYNPQRMLIAAPGGLGAKPSQFHYPADVAVSRAGRAYIADSWNHRIQVIDTATWQFVHIFSRPGREPGELLEPRGILCAADRVLVSERENHRLTFFDEQGQFLETRSRLPGLRQPLTHPGSMAPAGRHIVLLAEPQQALILDAQTLFCENIIDLSRYPLPGCVYAATPGTFILTTLTGGIHILGLDGSQLSSRQGLSEHAHTALAEHTGDALVMLTALDQKHSAPVRIPLALAPNEIIPESAFALSAFNTSLGRCANGDSAACEQAAALFAHHPACFDFQFLARQHTGLPHAAKERLNKLRITHTRTLEIHSDRFTGSNISCATAACGTGFFTAFTPDGLLGINIHGAEILTAQHGAYQALAAMPDGSMLAVVQRGSRDLLLLSPDGGTANTLLRGLPPRPQGATRAPAPCARDAHSFYMPDPTTNRVTIHSLETGETIKSLPGIFDTPSQVAADISSGIVYVLQRGGLVTAMRESGEILWESHPAALGQNRVAESISVCNNGLLFAVLAPQDRTRDDFSTLALMDSATGCVTRTMDYFSDPLAPGQVIHFEDITAPLDMGDGLIWVLHKINRCLYAFDVSGAVNK